MSAGRLTIEVGGVTVGPVDAALWDKLGAASVKIELKDGSALQKAKTRQVTKADDIAGGFRLTYEETLHFDVAAGYPGELRFKLCRAKTSALHGEGGTVAVGEAGLFVGQLVRVVAACGAKGLRKAFALYDVASGVACGALHLRVIFGPPELLAVPLPRESTLAAADVTADAAPDATNGAAA